MQDLVQKLYDYISSNNPDVSTKLEEAGAVAVYLSEKVNSIAALQRQLLQEERPAYIIAELCMEALTTDLRPSKFNYINALLSEDFEEEHKRFQEAGILTYEIINLVEACRPLFEEFHFSEENEDDQYLRYLVTGGIAAYFESTQ